MWFKLSPRNVTSLTRAWNKCKIVQLCNGWAEHKRCSLFFCGYCDIHCAQLTLHGSVDFKFTVSALRCKSICTECTYLYDANLLSVKGYFYDILLRNHSFSPPVGLSNFVWAHMQVINLLFRGSRSVGKKGERISDYAHK